MNLEADILVIGGGSASCMATIAARAHAPTVAVTLLEKGGDWSFDEQNLGSWNTFAP